MRAATATLKTMPSSSGISRTISVLQNLQTMVDVMVTMVMGAYFKTPSVRRNHSIRKISPSGVLCIGGELFVILGMILQQTRHMSLLLMLMPTCKGHILSRSSRCSDEI